MVWLHSNNVAVENRSSVCKNGNREMNLEATTVDLVNKGWGASLDRSQGGAT